MVVAVPLQISAFWLNVTHGKRSLPRSFGSWRKSFFNCAELSRFADEPKKRFRPDRTGRNRSAELGSPAQNHGCCGVAGRIGEFLGVGAAGTPRDGRTSTGRGRGASDDVAAGVSAGDSLRYSVGIVVARPVCLPLSARVRLSKNGRRSTGALGAAGAVVAGAGAAASERDVGIAFTTLLSANGLSIGGAAVSTGPELAPREFGVNAFDRIAATLLSRGGPACAAALAELGCAR